MTHKKHLPLQIVLLVLFFTLNRTCFADANTIGANTKINHVAKKHISLSFDDAPRGQGPALSGADRTQTLIDNLKQSDSGPVVFFVLTKHLNKPANKARIESYVKAGHIIANHTHTHPWLHKTDLSVYLTGIDRAESELKMYENRRNWFRYPYLDEGRTLEKRDAMRAALAERNLFNGYVTVDNYDWYLESKWKEAVAAGKTVDQDALRSVYIELLLSAAEFYDNIAVKHLGRSVAHTLLLHENDLAARYIGDLITAFRENGWEIIDPDTAYQDPIASQQPKTLRTGQGRVAALAFDAGADPSEMTHLAIEETQIDQLLEERKVFGH